MKNEKKSSLKETFKLHYRAFRLLDKECPQMFLSSFLATVVSAVTPYVGIYFSAQIINELSGAKNQEKLWNLVIWTLGTTAVLALFNAVLKRWKRYRMNNYYWRIRNILNEKLMKMDFCTVDRQQTYDLKAQILQNIQWGGRGLPQILYSYFDKLTGAVIRIISSIVLTVSLFTQQIPDGKGSITILNHPVFILAIVAVLLLTTFLAPLCVNKADSYWIKHGEMARMGNRYFNFFGFDMLEKDRMLDIRMYNQQDVCTEYMKKNDSFGTGSWIAKKARGSMGMFAAASGGISTVFTGLVYVFVCVKAWAGAFGVGSVTQYIGAITALSLGVSDLFETIGAMRNNVEFLKPTFEFLDIPNDMYQGSLTTEKRNDRKYEIEFKNVSFKYPGSETYALRNLSLKFRVGERLAVVGMNGSGKTTFIKLLCRLYDPEEGEILLNGINIRKYDYQDYMQLFSVVFQDFQLTAFTLGQNVAAGMNYDRERAEDCLRKAGFGDRLDAMPDGIDTYLYREFDEKGVNVSGGEGQKIALARVLYKDAPFIILDEPTAALDPIAEAEVYTKFNEIVEDKTAVYISHRLSSCRFCDEIVVFDQGQVVQQGSHEKLLAEEGGKYQELWNAQAQYYNEQNKANA